MGPLGEGSLNHSNKGLTFRSVVSGKNNQRGQDISQIIAMFVVPLR